MSWQSPSPMRGLVVWEVESKCSASKQERSEARDCQWGKQAADARAQREVRSKRLSVVRPLAREASAVVSTTVLPRLPQCVRVGRLFAGVPAPAGAIPFPIRVVPSARASWRECGGETKRKHAEHFFALQLCGELQSYKDVLLLWASKHHYQRTSHVHPQRCCVSRSTSIVLWQVYVCKLPPHSRSSKKTSGSRIDDELVR